MKGQNYLHNTFTDSFYYWNCVIGLHSLCTQPPPPTRDAQLTLPPWVVMVLNSPCWMPRITLFWATHVYVAPRLASSATTLTKCRLPSNQHHMTNISRASSATTLTKCRLPSNQHHITNISHASSATTLTKCRLPSNQHHTHSIKKVPTPQGQREICP